MDIILIAPEIIVFITALTVLVFESWGISIFGLGVSTVVSLVLFKSSGAIFNLSYLIDPFSSFFKIASLLVGIIIVILSVDYSKKFIKSNTGEFYALLLFAVLGMMLMVSSSNLIMIFISMEFLSLVSYILAGYLKGDKKSAESSIKYLLFGIAASAAMLYGMSFIYGMTGSLNLFEIGTAVTRLEYSPLLYFSLLLMLAGFGFKIAMVPFHLWMPDVFEGSPTPVAAFLSIGPKIAGFAVLLRFLFVSFPAFSSEWQMLAAIFDIITMTVGNLVALSQKNIKRMLAYSGISQVGYILIGLASVTSGLALPSVMFYLFVYLFMNLGAFAVIIAFSNQMQSDLIDDYSGLSEKSPMLAAVLAVFFLSLAGIPPLAGFVAKFYIFAAAVESGYLWLALIAVINTVISIYYYLNVVRIMYFVKAQNTAGIEISDLLKYAVFFCLIFILLIGIYPVPLLAAADAAKGMFSFL